MQVPAYLSRGWADFRLAGRAERAALAILYVDRGSGFNETNAYRLGYLGRDRATVGRFVPLRNATRMRVHISAPSEFSVDRIDCGPVGLWRVAVRAGWLLVLRYRPEPLGLVRLIAATLGRAGIRGLRREFANQLAHSDEQYLYDLWRERYDTDIAFAEATASAGRLRTRQTFSILLPIIREDIEFLDRAIEAVQRQSYPDWQLCVAIDRRVAASAERALGSLAHDVRCRLEYGDFSGRFDAAANCALTLASGEFAALLGTADQLGRDALLHAAHAFDSVPADIVYSDEDVIEADGRLVEPRFKPEWSPETLLSQNYVGRLCLYRRTLLREAGAIRGASESLADYDLLFRASEKAKVISHIPRVLYHRRRHAQLKGTEVREIAISIENALARKGLRSSVEAYRSHPGHFRTRIEPDVLPRTSIIIPTRDQPELLSRCLDSIFDRTTYADFDLCVVDNGSRRSKTLELLERSKTRFGHRFQIVTCDIEFNFARLVNLGVRSTRGELVVLLNDDTTIVTGDWLERMAGFALRPDIAAVGAKLLYPDGTIQHAGVILVGGVAGHSHRGQPGNTPGYRGRLLGVSNYSAITAACMMLRRAVFEELGGLDESLAVAFNDVDLCLRASAKGYRNVCIGDVVHIHHESRTRGHDDTPATKARFLAEFALMRDRWAPILDADPYYSPHLTRDAEDFAISPVGPSAIGDSVGRAVWDTSAR